MLPPANEVCEGYVFTCVCLSTVGGGPGPHPGGRLRGLAGGGSPGPHPWGRLRGLAGGSAGPHQGESAGPHLGESPGPHWEGSPGQHLGGLQAHTRVVSRPTPRGCIPACTKADPPADGYCCRQYTSYCNAFLFKGSFAVSESERESKFFSLIFVTTWCEH